MPARCTLGPTELALMQAAGFPPPGFSIQAEGRQGGKAVRRKRSECWPFFSHRFASLVHSWLAVFQQVMRLV